MMTRGWIGAAALLIATPALADVKAGVDAWGRGDYRKAVDEWRGPAVAGDPDAQFNLGQAYKLGRGVPVDLPLAEGWYRKAAQQGHVQAADNYGLALFENNKRTEALPWLEKSVARSEPRAQYVLGTMLFNGDGVKRDWVRAYALMTRASAAGLRQAVATLAQMDRYIGASDRQQGVALARSYEREAARPPLPSEVAGGNTPVAVPFSPVEPVVAEPRPTQVAQTPAPPPKPRTRPPVAPRPVKVAPITPALAPVRAPRVDGGWRVQLGSFRDPGNARNLWAQVGGRFPGRQPYFLRSGSLVRLLVGPFASQGEAARACGSVRPCVPTRG